MMSRRLREYSRSTVDKLPSFFQVSLSAHTHGKRNLARCEAGKFLESLELTTVSRGQS